MELLGRQIMVHTHHCVERANLKSSELTILRGMQAESGQPSTGKIGKSTSGYKVGVGDT